MTDKYKNFNTASYYEIKKKTTMRYYSSFIRMTSNKDNHATCWQGCD